MSKLNAYFRLCRPHQYLKNGFIWLPIFFGNELTSSHALFLTSISFAAFCLIASASYAINDLKDMDDDRSHPVKKKRPLASGDLKKNEAALAALVLFAGGMVLAMLLLPVACVYILIAYVLLNIAYSQRLKHLPIVDIFCIAIGFVLRILAGGMAARIYISPWIVTMTFLLALFLALAKRRDDLLLASQGNPVRRAIDGYNLEFISLAMGIMASVVIVAYLLYTISPEVVARHGTGKLYISGIWVLLGLLRYLQISFVGGKSGSPTRVLIKDRSLQAVIGLWLANLFFLLYWKGEWF
ncbi:decaprenyl-phosphate phosphoribosyltransferase [Desulfosarcina alkanivorans]|uniref:Decaprenyl-phosphate phosphoribosyltransferase n=1 Tax=Desulfosarcina alkanivorans TaxID=571177 RepID=A0A5K7Y9Z0_9BACT|nr:UbiA prenyltransferase family protein [Desulfosarcina alkanivorans]BBO66202.1 decaprenyl-phosphate phosphoribosyltransferase [Desulfosarcina alkanivorans]